MRPDSVEHNQEIEDRIEMEIIVDTYHEEERAMGWYYYLKDTINFPFKAKCFEKNETSPLVVNESFEVISMADTGDCLHDMFLMIHGKDLDLAVPLSQLQAIDSDDDTHQAIGDWRYWVNQGYCF